MESEHANSHILSVTPAEAGMKLLRFLERRLLDTPPKSMLHKWIRTGQVRVNGGRGKPFTLLASQDQIRVPPFAAARTVSLISDPDPQACVPDVAGHAQISPQTQRLLGADLPLLAATADLLVLNKPPGLACHPGSGQGDSVSERLARAFAGSPFIPSPAHRLDRRTSGLLLAAVGHAAQTRLHALFKYGGIRKAYLAWVAGDWSHDRPCLLRDILTRQRSADGREAVAALPEESRAVPAHQEGAACRDDTPALLLEARQPGFALSMVMPVKKIHGESVGLAQSPCLSLVLLRPLTGRKHQLRVQLSSRGFPIIGDQRYNGPRFPLMLLHAYVLNLPSRLSGEDCEDGGDRQEYTVLPDWIAPLMPDSADLDAIRQMTRVFDGATEFRLCPRGYSHFFTGKKP